ncbi:MAG TPA: sodium:solute symporter [Lacipirellulaceae bacterium]|nr:sodium:solute symporter [Lacipirellulaceae bacterium]
MVRTVDLIVLVAYLAAVVGIGFWFARRSTSTGEYTAAGRSLPGWAIGLSMFGSYISSISFLANPGKAYVSNWNAFVFSLATPIGAAVAVHWFVPFYRRSGHVSAYEHLEERFGPWARTYAVVCFLLYQTARMGTVIYLLAKAVAPLTGLPVPTTIIITGTLMTLYTLAGGIKAVVWTGVLQSVVLIAGTAACIIMLLVGTPGGPAAIISEGIAADKFSVGSFAPSLFEPTFWVLFVFGLVTHLTNFGVDQSYVQRYITARSDQDAAKSVWITTLMYVPAAAVFFFIGTALFVYYGNRPALLPSGGTADDVFPHFIATGLPVGMAGLVVAAIFAASMDSNFNSMATLTLYDLYKRYLRPQADEREAMRALHLATAFWGGLSIAMGLSMIRVQTALDAWWNLAGLFSGGVLGLFLLGLVCRRTDGVAAAIAVTLGALAMIWMSLPSLFTLPPQLRNPLHAHMTIVVGTAVIFVVGLALTKLRALMQKSGGPPTTTAES